MGLTKKMGTLRNLSERFQLALDAYDQTLQETIEETKGQIITYNQQQLYSGITSNGSKITPQYGTPSYAKIKYNDNPSAGLGTPDLYLYGDFYNGMGVVVNQKSFVTSSSDSKAGKLELKYGSEIYGLDAQNSTSYSLESVRPILFAKIKSQTTG